MNAMRLLMGSERKRVMCPMVRKKCQEWKGMLVPKRLPLTITLTFE